MRWWGVERRLFVLAAGLGFLTWNLTVSLVAGLLVSAAAYGAACWSTQRDPQLLHILTTLYRGPHRQGFRLRTTFDPLHCRPARITVHR